MKRKIFTTIALFTLLNAQESYEDKLIQYHQTISQWLTQSTDSLDRYLSSQESKAPNNTQIDLSLTLIPGTDGSFDTDYGFNVHLDMPRFSKKVHFLFNQIEDNWSGTKGNKPPQLHNDIYDKNREKNYNFGFEYRGIDSDKFHLGLTGGVRFNKSIIEPYIGVDAKKRLLQTDKQNIYFKNIVKLYLKGEIQDIAKVESIYNIDKSSLIGTGATLGYSSNSDNQSLLLDANYFYALDRNRYINSGIMGSYSLTKFSHIKADQYKIFTQYRDRLLNKDWLYYKVTPSIQWKRINDFHSSFHVGVTLGVKFGAIK